MHDWCRWETRQPSALQWDDSKACSTQSLSDNSQDLAPVAHRGSLLINAGCLRRPFQAGMCTICLGWHRTRLGVGGYGFSSGGSNLLKDTARRHPIWEAASEALMWREKTTWPSAGYARAAKSLRTWSDGAVGPPGNELCPHTLELVSSPEGGDGNWVGASRIAVLNRFSVGLKSHLLDCLYWRGTLGHFNGFSAFYISVWSHPIAHFVY